jgi:3-deoxy-7-phosphoheptulonate synthase/chorismate mutase
MGDPVVDELRARIAIADRRLLAAVNDRLTLVEELRREKDARGIAFLDPDQERRLIEALVAANPGPLGEPAVRELVTTVLELTKRELARRSS